MVVKRRRRGGLTTQAVSDRGGRSARPPGVGRPRVFRQTRVLLVGCGDIGRRVLPVLTRIARVRVLVRDVAHMAAIRCWGAQPLRGDLDDPSSLYRLAGLASRLLHLAPPPGQGREDPRTRALMRVLRRGESRLQQGVYASTTGVYGDAQGAWVSESRMPAPRTDRAWRRVCAEQSLRAWGRADQGPRMTFLRIPGIYALDRRGGDPRERVSRAVPVLCQSDDVYTNHIHAHDLARACQLALWRGRPQRVLHVCDGSARLMGDHFDHVADLCGLARPPRITWQQAQQQFSPMQLSFLGESRRLCNRRLRRELRLRLHYPDVSVALRT